MHHDGTMEEFACIKLQKMIPFPYSLGYGKAQKSSPEASKEATMTSRLIPSILALASLALAGCTTMGASDPLSVRWTGKEAGKFFAAYGPPHGDSAGGGGATYFWKGGYASRTIPAQYETGKDGKKGKMISRARNAYLSCAVELKVDADYRISSIRAISDRPGAKEGTTYCQEFLDALQAEKPAKK